MQSKSMLTDATKKRLARMSDADIEHDLGVAYRTRDTELMSVLSEEQSRRTNRRHGK